MASFKIWRYRVSQMTKPSGNRSDLIFISEIRCVFQSATLEKRPDFRGHLRFNSRADEEGMRLALVHFKCFANSIECCSGCFPMFVRAGRVNTSFQFSQSNVSSGIFICILCQVFSTTSEQAEVNIISEERNRKIIDQCSSFLCRSPT